MDKPTLVDSIDFLDVDWIKPRQDACLTTIYMYAKISDSFERDPKYGPTFVKTHQELIAELVKISMSKLVSSDKNVE